MLPTRRDLLKAGCAAVTLPTAIVAARIGATGSAPIPLSAREARAQQAAPLPVIAPGGVVNDLHSQLNATAVSGIARPATVEELRAVILAARERGASVSVAGGRHAMGGQQFGARTIFVDMCGLNRVISLDAERGILEAEAGAQWPALLDWLERAQQGREPQWGIRQKQTGADRLSLGGALAANIHGRGLKLPPFIADVESFDLLNHRGELLRCSRSENDELFRLAIGGYGLFGVVARVRLRLAPRQKIERVVELTSADALMSSFDERIAAGYLYGDFQYATESESAAFLHDGVFSCYRPVDPATPIPAEQGHFSEEDWACLIHYAHVEKRRAFELYSKRYLQTNGQIYWSDTHQLSYYKDHYHEDVDRKLRVAVKGTEMITELYVPRASLAAFLDDARRELRSRRADVFYGTIRLIAEDTESFLRWARQPYACVIFNLHVTHLPDAIEQAAEAFRALIDLAILRDGSYYLTYHRWARKDQVLACYPQFPEFLRLKRQYDPGELFQSDWYRHYGQMFA